MKYITLISRGKATQDYEWMLHVDRIILSTQNILWICVSIFPSLTHASTSFLGKHIRLIVVYFFFQLTSFSTFTCTFHHPCAILWNKPSLNKSISIMSKTNVWFYLNNQKRVCRNSCPKFCQGPHEENLFT